MKYVFVCPEVSGNGGTETVLTKVANYLAVNHEVKVVLTTPVLNQAWLDSFSNQVELSSISSWNKFIKLVHVIKHLKQLHPDDKVVILGANLVKLASRYRKIFHRRWEIISWIHFSLINQTLFDPANLLFADRHWAISGPIKQQLMDLGVPATKISLIYNPVTVTKRPLNNPGADLRLVYVGQVMAHGQKNLSELLMGINQASQMVKVDLIGAPIKADPVVPLIDELELSDRVTLHGWTKKPWKEVLLLHPTALVLTSKYEGLPMVMIEAMAHGIPCLVANFSGYEDVLITGVNGYVYQQGNLASFQAALTKLSQTSFDAQTIQASVGKFSDDEYFKRVEKALNPEINTFK